MKPWSITMAQNYCFAREQDFRFDADNHPAVGDELTVCFRRPGKEPWVGRVVEVRPNRGAAGTVMVVAVNE